MNKENVESLKFIEDLICFTCKKKIDLNSLYVISEGELFEHYSCHNNKVGEESKK